MDRVSHVTRRAGCSLMRGTCCAQRGWVQSVSVTAGAVNFTYHKLTARMCTIGDVQSIALALRSRVDASRVARWTRLRARMD